MRFAYVYIMSNKSHRLYVGWTGDLLRRFDDHKNKVYPEAFTARYNFDRLVWFETVTDEEAAMTRERKIVDVGLIPAGMTGDPPPLRGEGLEC